MKGLKVKILLIHTGGTIGMVPGTDGLEPCLGLVERAVQGLIPADVSLRVVTFSPLVDSSDIGPVAWNRIIDAVIEGHEDGVVITHGTDTMAFTGAALAQALAGTQQRVILCGSMKPLGQGGDAEGNLSLAITAALGRSPDIHSGVWLAFDGALLHGAGLVKHDSSQASAFRSVPQSIATPTARRFGAARVAILTLSPGMPAAMLRAALAELDGAVLRVFGSGTVMDDDEILAILRDAVARGCRMRAVSQCESGGLAPGTYAAGAALWAAGIENGGVQTPEAALASVWLALS
jgi:L-asparaginase